MNIEKPNIFARWRAWCNRPGPIVAFVRSAEGHNPLAGTDFDQGEHDRSTAELMEKLKARANG